MLIAQDRSSEERGIACLAGRRGRQMALLCVLAWPSGLIGFVSRPPTPGKPFIS